MYKSQGVGRGAGDDQLGLVFLGQLFDLGVVQALSLIHIWHIGELVMNELRKLDKVAYVRFASVYKSFEDIGEFVEAIREMQGPVLPGKLRKE